MTACSRHGFCAALSLLALSHMPSAAAAAGEWVESDPPGGSVRQFVPAGGATIYMVAGDTEEPSRIYVSHDAGASWSFLGSMSSTITCLVIDPSDSRHMIATTLTSGVMQSTVGGELWHTYTSFTQPPVSTYIYTSAAIRSDNPDKIFAASGAHGLYASADGGKTWSKVAGFPVRRFLKTVIIDQAHPDTMYAGAEGGVLKSMNGGTTWVSASAGMSVTDETVDVIVVDPSDSNRLYAVKEDGLIYLSTDAAASWTPMNGTSGIGNGLGTLGGAPDYIAIDPSNSSNLVAAYSFGTTGFTSSYYSSDGGVNWSPLADFTATYDTPATTSVMIDPANSAHILAGTQYGVFSSGDTGASWASSNRGFDSMSVSGLAVDHAHAGVLYATSTDGGVFRSGNAGASWSAMNNFSGSLDLTTIGLAGGGASKLYAAQSFGNILVSPDGGGSWNSYNPQTSSSIADISLITPSPGSPNKVYAFDQIASNVIVSMDAGQTWSPTGHGLPASCSGCVLSIVVDPSTPSTLYLGADGGVLKSTDSGAHWNTVLQLPPGAAGERIVQDPKQRDVLYFTTIGYGLMKSTDGGSSWAKVASAWAAGLFEVDCIAIDPADSHRILLNDFSAGLYASADGGDSWQIMSKGLLPYDHAAGACSSLSFDPATPNRYFMVIDGIFESYSGPLPKPASSGGGNGDGAASGGGAVGFLQLMVLGFLGLVRARRKYS